MVIILNFCSNTGTHRIDHFIATNGTLSSWFHFKEIDTLFNGRCYILQLNEDFKRFTTLGK